MNQREWKVQGAKVDLTVASSVTKESGGKWSAKYDLKAEYKIAALKKVLHNGAHRLASAIDRGMGVSASASGCLLTARPGALSFDRDAATGH